MLQKQRFLNLLIKSGYEIYKLFDALVPPKEVTILKKKSRVQKKKDIIKVVRLADPHAKYLAEPKVFLQGIFIKQKDKIMETFKQSITNIQNFCFQF